MTGPGQPVHVVLVEAPACHFCEDAHRVLDDLADRHLIDLHVVDATSPAGATVVARHRAPMFPVVIVDGDLFSYGRLPRRKLAKRLGTSSAQMAG